jgi:Fic family protein
MQAFIYQQNNWPNFTWKNDEIINLLSETRNLQGRLLGKMESLGSELSNKLILDTLTLDVLKSSEIEGEFLNPDQVRSSIARRLGMEIASLVESDQNLYGVVEMMLDGIQNCFMPLSADRLFDWHAALFPPGRSGMYKITRSGLEKRYNWTDASGIRGYGKRKSAFSSIGFFIDRERNE